MPTESTFGEVLRTLREERGLSQQALAAKAGISQISVSFYEQGKREPGWNAVVAICGALAVDCIAFRGLLAKESEPPRRGGPAKRKASPEKLKHGRTRGK